MCKQATCLTMRGIAAAIDAVRADQDRVERIAYQTLPPRIIRLDPLLVLRTME